MRHFQYPAIIDPEVFEKVQEIREQRHRRTKSGKSHMFSGLIFCADCKGKMYFNGVDEKENKWFFSCSNARSGTKSCTSHYNDIPPLTATFEDIFNVFNDMEEEHILRVSSQDRTVCKFGNCNFCEFEF